MLEGSAYLKWRTSPEGQDGVSMYDKDRNYLGWKPIGVDTDAPTDSDESTCTCASCRTDSTDAEKGWVFEGPNAPDRQN
jgi:hypothetical protein